MTPEHQHQNQHTRRGGAEEKGAFSAKEAKDAKQEKGFDVVIGNPPYGAEFTSSLSEYFKERFITWVGRGESYLLFVERALLLTRIGGAFGYIIPDTYLNLGFTTRLRTFLLENSLLCELVVLPRNVFEGTIVDTTLLFAEREAIKVPYHESQVSVKCFDKTTTIHSISNPTREFHAPARVWFEMNTFSVQSNCDDIELLEKCAQGVETIADIAEMFSGIKVY